MVKAADARRSTDRVLVASLRARACESVVMVHERLEELTLPQIDVLRRMNYRGANVANINDDRVVEELLKP